MPAINVNANEPLIDIWVSGLFPSIPLSQNPAPHFRWQRRELRNGAGPRPSRPSSRYHQHPLQQHQPIPSPHVWGPQPSWRDGGCQILLIWRAGGRLLSASRVAGCQPALEQELCLPTSPATPAGQVTYQAGARGGQGGENLMPGRSACTR